MSRLALLLLSVVVLTQCGTPDPPRCWRVPPSSRQPVQRLVEDARHHWNVLNNPGRKSEWPAAQEGYNTAITRLFDRFHCSKDSWENVAAALGTRILPAGEEDALLGDMEALFPASIVKTDKVGERKITRGIGLPLVGWHQQSSEGRPRAPFLPPTGQPFNVTALLRFDRGSTPAWQFAAPLQKDTTTIGGRKMKLAADWSAGHAFYWHMTDLDDLDALKVILPARFTEETGLYFGQPYDPDRIPVVFVHGINSSPATFKSMINFLAGEEWFRKKYQVWFFNYPTGNPWILSAAHFRENMIAAEKFASRHGDRGNIHKTVIVAHSMGGLVSRAALSNPEKFFYDCYFKKPLDQLSLSQEGRHMIRNGLLYEPLDFPTRVVYMAVPHQGSPMAERIIFTWLSRLVRLPKTLSVGLVDITLRNAGDILRINPERIPTGIDNLSPHDPSIKAIQHTRMRKGLHYNSIIGDRGRGDTPDSSDGIVPYWSSHLAGADSEKIVPSGHSVPSNPEAAGELLRILKIHAASN